ncbi:MAG: hypothetical protein H6R37_1458, partial [Deltaproteobacteria bacterium]|nr:hypothetical protein [Deltaproteobacteria bacterium]
HIQAGHNLHGHSLFSLVTIVSRGARREAQVWVDHTASMVEGGLVVML